MEVKLAGAADYREAEHFKRALLDLIQSGHPNLILNLEDASFLSSTAIGACTLALKEANRRNGALAVVNTPDAVREVFQLLGLAQYFRFSETREEAIQSFHSSEPASPFPAVGRCPVCARRIRLARPGIFRCTSCTSIVEVTDDAAVRLR
jgi:anti-anti-sigma factor